MPADDTVDCPGPEELAELLAHRQSQIAETPEPIRNLLQRLDHWLQSCSTCKRNLREIQYWQRVVAHPDPRIAVREYPRIRELWSRLEGLTPRQLTERLDGPALREFVEPCRWALAQRLLRESQSTVSFDYERACEFAELSIALVMLLPVEEYGEVPLRDLEIQALACAGNAQRVGDQLNEARLHFDQALRRIERRPPVPLPTQAMVADLFGSLLRDMRELHEAEQTWLRAVTLYLHFDDRSMAGKVHLNLGNVSELRGELHCGVRYLRKAQGLVDPGSDPSLYGICHQHLLYFCTEVELLDEAEALLPRVRRLWHRMRHQHNLALTHWVEGRIRQARGELEEAERIFRVLIRTFHRQHRPYEVALLHLDLSALSAEQGDLEHARDLASQACATLQLLHVPKQVESALQALVDLVETEELTANALRASLKRLQRIVRASQDPLVL